VLRSETMDWWTRVGAVLGVAPQPVSLANGTEAAPTLEPLPGTSADA
jgi:hypothetical protein